MQRNSILTLAIVSVALFMVTLDNLVVTNALVSIREDLEYRTSVGGACEGCHRQFSPLGYAFLPFGSGPRICIGAGFAMVEAVVILATVIRAFRFHALSAHRPRPVARVTLRPAGGMPLIVTDR